jgi:UDP-GlcNAc:undecaprenyl-phosphate GlcNAc-1-phosphate transferase
VIPAVAFVATLAAAPLSQALARRCGLVNRPAPDRWSKRETPLLGGVALVAGIAAGLAVAALLLDVPFGGPRARAVLAGAVLMFAVGAWDDVKGVRPATKLAAQVAAAAILVLGGVKVELAGRDILGIPLTIFWVVGITNALNLLDNMDGLASGVGAIAALVLAAFGAASGVEWLPAVALSVAGAALGFLPWNVSPARQFLGDAGSLPFGFLLAAAGILGTYRDAGNVLLVLVAPVFVLGVPILDTTLVTLVRKFHGRKVSQGGRDHLSHRLVALGMSERRAVAVLWVVAAVLGGVALLAAPQGKDEVNTETMVIFGLAAAGAAIFGVVLGEVKIYHAIDDAAGEQAERAREKRDLFLFYFRAVAVVFLDLLFVAAAYTAAHALRFGGRGEPFDRIRFFEGLPVVIVAKLVALQAFGLQRGFWRYFGLRDLASVGSAVAAGSILTVLGLGFIYGWSAGFSRYVLVLDAVLLFLFLVGSRAVFRLVVEHLAGFPDDGVPVLLVGAGVEGDLALRALRIRGGVRPVGILDADPSLRGRAFHGIPILGRPEDLEKVLAGNGAVKEVVLARAEEPGEQERLRAVARAAGAKLLLAPTALRFTEI